MKKQVGFRLLISLSINTAIACLAIFVFGTRLNVNDDNVIGYLVFGIHGEATSRAYYTNVILGWIYRHLFALVPEFNWQTLSYYVGLVFSGTVSFYAILKKKDKILTLLWLFFMFVFFHDAYVSLTFSVVAGFAACQGYLALFLTVNEKEKSICSCFFSGVAIVYASMVRIESFVCVSGFAFFVWLVLFYTKVTEDRKVNKETLKKYVYPFAAILGAAFLIFAFDRQMYADGEWKAYKVHEDATSIITDSRTVISELGFPALGDEGINASMAKAIIAWRNNDPEILTTEVMERISETASDYNYFVSPKVWNEYGVLLKFVFSKFFEVYFAFLVIGLLLYSAWREKGKEKNWLPLALLIPFFAEFFYYAFIGRSDEGECPERCVYLVLMGLAAGAVALYGTMNQKDTESVSADKFIKRAFVGLLLVGTIIVQLTKDFSVNGLGLVDNRAIKEEYEFLGHNDKVYVCEYDVRTELESMFGAWQVPPSGFLDHCILIGGWTIDHPVQNALQASLGCENPLRALFEKDNVYYISKRCTEDEVLEYLRQNYDERIDFEYVKEKGEFAVYKYSLE